MSIESTDQWVTMLRSVFTSVARTELPGVDPDITWHTHTMTMPVPCGTGNRFILGVRSEMFLVFYNESFLHLSFLDTTREEIEECLTEAVREIKRVAEGRSTLVEGRSRFRKVPRFDLTTTSGEVWRFTPAGGFPRTL